MVNLIIVVNKIVLIKSTKIYLSNLKMLWLNYLMLINWALTIFYPLRYYYTLLNTLQYQEVATANKKYHKIESRGSGLSP